MRHSYRKHYPRKQENTIKKVSEVLPVGLPVFLSLQNSILPLFILVQTSWRCKSAIGCLMVILYKRKNSNEDRYNEIAAIKAAPS